MGGKKRSTLKKAEVAQQRKGRAKAKQVKVAESQKKRISGITAPDVKDEKVLNEIKKMRVITPYSVASRYELRISIAKKFLKALEKRGNIELVSKNRDLRIYRAR